MLRKSVILIGVGVGVLIVAALLAIPVKQICPHGPCSSAPDAQGYVHRYYEVKPFGITVLENLTGSAFALHYSEGTDLEQR